MLRHNSVEPGSNYGLIAIDIRVAVTHRHIHRSRYINKRTFDTAKARNNRRDLGGKVNRYTEL